MKTMLQELNHHDEKLIWTNVYGFARSILALGTLITLSFHNVDILFHPAGIEYQSHMEGVFLHKLSLFNLLNDNLIYAKIIAMIILALVLSGWRPRYTGILHWWVAYSFNISCAIIDGGDQMSSVLSLMLIPITLSDPRKNHWQKAVKTDGKHLNLIIFSVFLMIRLQVSIVYLQAGIAKAFVEEWADGTALYYWFTHPVFGANETVRFFLEPVLRNGFFLTFLTWMVMIFEVFLFLALFLEKKWRPYLLVLGIGFHFSIIIIHGLVSFFCSMTAALILFLRPADESFHFTWVNNKLNKLQEKRTTKSFRLKWLNS